MMSIFNAIGQNWIVVYVTGKACNDAFHEILENFSHSLK